MLGSYPPAPWHLQGHGVQTIQSVRISDVRPLIPSELKIVPIWPGRTLGVIAMAHYGPGSVIEYDELIVAPAIVRFRGQFGVWVSHIYVNDPTSMQGGREIWGVPKELAEFTWNDDGKVGEAVATMGGRRLASIRVSRRWWIARRRMTFPTFSRLGRDLIRFSGDAFGQVGWGRGEVDVPPDSPFGGLRFSRPLVSLWLREMTLVCQRPEPVGTTELAPMEGLQVQPAPSLVGVNSLETVA